MLTAAAVLVGSAAMQSARGDDVMYVGDGGDNSLKAFNAATGEFLGTVVKSQGGLHGPRGLLIDGGGNLLVSDQNSGTSTQGEVSLYSSATGKLLSRVVSHDDQNAPTVPRGTVTTSTALFVADFTAESRLNNHPPTPGRVRVYSTAGAFIADLSPPVGQVPPDNYHPRAVVIGPDGLLYVSNFPNLTTGLGGDVLRFSPSTGAFMGVFISDAGGVNHLNRPEGIVFGPDDKLYLTSFRADATDTDKIRIYQGPGGASPGAFVDAIDLDVAGQSRAFGQALIFGPGGRLFVPITGNGPDTGSVRRYNVATKAFDVFVPADAQDGPLGQPWYPTFGKTNPSTLSYEP